APTGIKPVKVAPVIVKGLLKAKSSAVSISMAPGPAGRLAKPALPSGAPVSKITAPAAVPDSKAHMLSVAISVSGCFMLGRIMLGRIMVLLRSASIPALSYSILARNSREVDYTRYFLVGPRHARPYRLLVR